MVSEMFGEDRDEALSVIDNDPQFDAWLRRFNQKNKGSHKNSSGNKVSKERFFSRMKGKLPQPGTKKDGNAKDGSVDT